LTVTSAGGGATVGVASGGTGVTTGAVSTLVADAMGADVLAGASGTALDAASMPRVAVGKPGRPPAAGSLNDPPHPVSTNAPRINT